MKKNKIGLYMFAPVFAQVASVVVVRGPYDGWYNYRDHRFINSTSVFVPQCPS